MVALVVEELVVVMVVVVGHFGAGIGGLGVAVALRLGSSRGSNGGMARGLERGGYRGGG